MAERVQRKRTPGWRMPKGAVYVGRPTQWGNPFASSAHTPAQRVEFYRTAIMGAMPIAFAAGLVRIPSIIEYSNAVIERLASLPIAELRGRDLACWCPLDQPCHADVLLEVANAEL